jgi:hypothetical protein
VVQIAPKAAAVMAMWIVAASDASGWIRPLAASASPGQERRSRLHDRGTTLQHRTALVGLRDGVAHCVGETRFGQYERDAVVGHPRPSRAAHTVNGLNAVSEPAHRHRHDADRLVSNNTGSQKHNRRDRMLDGETVRSTVAKRTLCPWITTV